MRYEVTPLDQFNSTFEAKSDQATMEHSIFCRVPEGHLIVARAIHRWGGQCTIIESRKGRPKCQRRSGSSVVPMGLTKPLLSWVPSSELLGYYRESLWDKEYCVFRSTLV